MRTNALHHAIGHALSLGCMSAASAATISVNSSVDDAMAVDDGSCTLREAIQAANSNAMVDGCSAGDDVTLIDLDGDGMGETGGDVIDLTPLAGATISLTTALDTITTNVGLTGNGSTVTRDALAAPFRILDVSYDTTNLIGGLNLDSLTISNGSVDAMAGSNGGGIRSTGPIVITNSYITDNTVAGATLNSGDGGGIFATGSLVVNGSTFSGNQASNDGGAIAVDGPASITDSTFSMNIANDDGGGIESDNVLTISGGTFTGNTAYEDGGAIDTNEGNAKLTITGVSFDANTSYGYGGALYVDGDLEISGNSTFSSNYSYVSGAIDFNFGRGGPGTPIQGNPGQISDTVFDSNTAYYLAGAIGVYSGRMELNNVTLTNNITASSNYLSGGGVEKIAGPGRSKRSGRKGLGGPPFCYYFGGGALVVNSYTEVIADNLIATGNVAAAGAAICADGLLELTNSNLSMNGSPLTRLGGAIALGTGEATLSTVTLDQNIGYAGGGIGVGFVPFFFQTPQKMPAEGLGEALKAGLDANKGYLYSGAQIDASDITVTGNAGYYGGGLLVYGQADIADSLIAGNYAYVAGGMFGIGYLTVSRSDISANSAVAGAGGVVVSGTFDMTQSTVAGNSASGDTGGLGLYDVRATISESLFTGNYSAEGATSLTTHGETTIVNSTFSGNLGQISVVNYGETPQRAKGGGPEPLQPGLLTMQAVTLNEPGTALYVVSGTANLSQSIIVGGSAACTESLPGSLVAGNDNFANDSSCDQATVASNLALGALADNGGPTQSLLPLPGNEGVDALANCGGLNIDQRGFDRPTDADGDLTAQCDAGAVEVQNIAVMAVDDDFSTPADSVLTVAAINGLLTNESDSATDEDGPLQITEINGDPSNVGNTINPMAGGILTINADGSLSFDPNGEFDSLRGGETVLIQPTTTTSDGFATSMSTATITVVGVNEAPTIMDGQAFGVTDQAFSGDAVGTVVASDPDSGDSLTWLIIGGNTDSAFSIDPATGAIEVANAAALDASVNPTFNLTIQVNDDGSPPMSDLATVMIAVTAVGDEPVATDDVRAAEFEDSGTLVIPMSELTQNDSAGNMDTTDTLTITSVSNAVGGAVSINGNEIEFVLADDFFGTASFDYTVEDGADGSDTAAVTIPITGVNDPPTFTVAADPTFPMGASGLQQVADFATVTSFGPAESSQNVRQFIVSESSDIVTGVSIDNAGNLNFVLTGQPGTATVDVQLQDSGGTDNGGDDLSPTVSFDISVTGSVDLAITKDNDQGTFIPGTITEYLILVSNTGPADAVGATVTDNVPADLLAVEWSCTAVSGASCTAQGTGSINDTVDIPAGATIAYLLSGTVDPNKPPTTGTLENTASVSAAMGTIESDTSNNESTDVDIPDIIFRDGLEELPTIAFSAKSVVLTHDQLAASVSAVQPMRPSLVLTAIDHDQLALAMIHARRVNGVVEVRVSRLENGIWKLGRWQAAGADRNQISW